MNWNNYQSKVKTQLQYRSLGYLAHSSFQGVNKLFALSFSNGISRTGNKSYFLPNVQIEGYNIMTDGHNFFDQSIKEQMITFKKLKLQLVKKIIKQLVAH